MPVADCRVCTRLPRTLTSSQEIDVWKAAEPLLPPVPREEASGFRTSCPLCGAIYVYDLRREHEDGTLWTTASLDRLSFVHRILAAPPAERAALEAELPGQIVAWREGLDEGSAWAQAESAWNLCCLVDLDGSWEPVTTLLRSRHVAARVEAAQFLLARRAQLPDAVLDAVVPLLDDVGAFCRSVAVKLLAPRRLARGEAAQVVTELLADGDQTRRVARLEVLVRHVDAAVAAESPRLVPLLEHPDEPTRDLASRVVARCLKDAPTPPGLVPLLLDRLRGESPDVAKAALTALSCLRERCDDAVPLVARWCTDATASFAAYSFLTEQARLGTRVHALLPVFEARLATTRDPATPAKLLLRMLASTDDKLPVIRAMLPGLDGAWATSLALAIRATAESGYDLTPLLPELRAVRSNVMGHVPELVALVEKQRTR